MEKNFILAKVIQLFGFVLYSEMDCCDCVPNPLFLNRQAGLSFLAFLERMFKKCKTFKLSAGVSMFPCLINVLKNHNLCLIFLVIFLSFSCSPNCTHLWHWGKKRERSRDYGCSWQRLWVSGFRLWTRDEELEFVASFMWNVYMFFKGICPKTWRIKEFV